MRIVLLIMAFLTASILFTACKKGKSSTVSKCSSKDATIRQLVNKKATVYVTATLLPVYLVEEGAIDTKLVPCYLAPEFMQNNLEVTISGDVKATVQPAMMPCCVENFVITAIKK